jgi:CDP-glycerol glycerophosphotransferase (TagB/SpsB family)
VALQHGILYPKYYSYRHEPDEGDCPLPERTAVFGEEARRLLVTLGRYAPESLVPTGSPKFDELLRLSATWDRALLRERLGVGAGQRLIVVASRFRGIRETHQSIGSALPRLVRAIDALPDVICVVKPHPAESAQPYEACLRAECARQVRVTGPGADLMQLLHAADALITVESLSAVEAIVLDRPLLILNTPTNLAELVEHGVAIGVAQGEDPRPALQRLLFDEPTRERLRQARQRYLADLAFGVDGQATSRIVDLIRTAALSAATARP